MPIDTIKDHNDRKFSNFLSDLAHKCINDIKKKPEFEDIIISNYVRKILSSHCSKYYTLDMDIKTSLNRFLTAVEMG